MLSQAAPIKECHRIKICVFVDQSYVAAIHQEPIILAEIQTLPKSLTKLVPSKIPVICFFDNCSVICTWKEENGRYEFLNSWNGENLYSEASHQSHQNGNWHEAHRSRISIFWRFHKERSTPNQSLPRRSLWKTEYWISKHRLILLNFH